MDLNLEAKALHSAVRQNDHEEIQRIMSVAPKAASICVGGTPAFHVAVTLRNLELIKLMLSCGADPDCKSLAGMTPLGRATRNDLTEVVALLANHGANPNIHDNMGQIPLHWAVKNIDIAEILLNAGANPNKKDSTGSTPLHLAIANSTIVEKMLQAGADPYIKNTQGMSPLSLATSRNQVASAQLMLELGGTDKNSASKSNLLQSAIRNCEGPGASDLIQSMIDSGASLKGSSSLKKSDDVSPLMMAAERGDGCVFRHTLEQIDKTNLRKNYPDLLSAICASRTDSYNFRDMISLIAPFGYSVNHRIAFGQTPLHRAAKINSLFAMRWLIDQGADVNAGCSSGKTALHYLTSYLAYRTTSGFEDMRGLKMLLKAGADRNILDKNNHKAVDYVYAEERRISAKFRSEGHRERMRLIAFLESPFHVFSPKSESQSNDCSAASERRVDIDVQNSPEAPVCPPLKVPELSTYFPKEGIRESTAMAMILDQKRYIDLIDGSIQLEAFGQPILDEIIFAFQQLQQHKTCAAIDQWIDVIRQIYVPSSMMREQRPFFIGWTRELCRQVCLMPDLARMESRIFLDRLVCDLKDAALPELVAIAIDLEQYLLRDPKKVKLLPFFPPTYSLDLIFSGVNDPDVVDMDGCTLLFSAARDGDEAFIRELYSHGATIDWRSHNGRTALHVCVANGRDIGAKILLDLGASLRLADTKLYDRFPFLHCSVGLARIYRGTAKCLRNMIRNHKDPHNFAALGMVEEMAKLIAADKTVLSKPDENGWYMIHWAVAGEWIQAINFLVQSGDDINRRGYNGWTPLHVAVWRRATRSVIDCLVKLGADVNAKDDEGVGLMPGNSSYHPNHPPVLPATFSEQPPSQDEKPWWKFWE